MNYVIPAPAQPSVEVNGSSSRFPVRRIFCVGRNYAAHVREMGNNEREHPPVFFTKPADAVVANGASIPYASRTSNLHHEVELVLALGGGGANIAKNDASALIFGYAVGNDLTRRDLQGVAQKGGQPWDTSKGFDRSAPIAAIHQRKDVGLIESGEIWLKVNGRDRQRANISDLIWKVPEIVAELSTLFELMPGDLIFTGTPAGVGPLERGDTIEAGIDGLTTLTNKIV